MFAANFRCIAIAGAYLCYILYTNETEGTFAVIWRRGLCDVEGTELYVFWAD